MAESDNFIKVHGTTARWQENPAIGVFHIGAPHYSCFTNDGGVEIWANQSDRDALACVGGRDLNYLDDSLLYVNLNTMRKKIVNISFAVTSIPNPGDYTDQFGVFRNDATPYTEGDIIYSDGSELYVVKAYDDSALFCSHITTKDAINFSTQPDLDANSLYAWEGNAWVKKGSSSTTNGLRVIKITITNNGTTNSSSTTVAQGDVITKVEIHLTAGSSSNERLQVFAGTEELMDSSDGDLLSSASGHYITLDTILCGADHAGAISVDKDPTWNGTGYCYVYFTTPVS